VSGSNLASGSKYRTEIETYGDITYKSINGYLCFEVKTKEGLTMEYGSSADSYIEAQGSSVALTWLLRKVTDANGNYTIYNYGENNANGEYWLNNIQYTGNDSVGVSPVNIIEFVYQANRFDSQKSYVAGKRLMQTLRLDMVRVKTNSQIQREYVFDYNATDDFYTKLSTIHLFAEGIHYQPTEINWKKLDSTTEPEFEYFTNNMMIGNTQSNFTMDKTMVFTDFNNDGFVDLIRPTLTSIGNLYAYDGWEIYISNSGLDFGNAPSQSETFDHNPFSPFYGQYQLLPADINNDGISDIVEIKISGGCDIDVLLTIDGQLERQNLALEITGSSDDKFMCEMGDFNGDGYSELLVKKSNRISQINTLSLYRIDIASNQLLLLSTTTVSGNILASKTTDINGNNIPDLFFQTSSNEIKFLEFNNSVNLFTEITFTHNLFFLADIEFGDFNGDGKTDVLEYLSGRTLKWRILLSTGSSFEEIDCPLTRTKYNPSNDYEPVDFYSIKDLNGDGKGDIIEVPRNSDEVTIYYFNGADFITTTHSISNANGFVNDRSLPYYDINGDGKCDIINTDYNSFSVISFFTNETERRVSSITNGLHQKKIMEYKYLSDDDVYSNGTTVYTGNVVKLCLGIPVVSRATLHADGVNSSITDYFYKGLRLHTKGKGMLGFEEFIEDNNTQNIKTTSKFGFNATYFNTYLTQQIVSTSAGSSISTTSFTNNVTSLGGKRIFPYVSSQTTTDHLTGLSETKTVSNFDNYGNPRTIQTTKGGLIETKTIAYIQKGAWCLNKPDSITAVTTYAGQSDTRKIKYEYDNKGNLTKEIVNPNSPEYKVTTEYANFNNFGQPQTIAVKAKDATGVERTRSSSTTYTSSGTSKGRFITSKTNVLGETTTYDWDETRGLLNSETTKGKTTYYTYDGFGRLKETKYPDGNRQTQVLQWAGGSGPTGAIYYSYTQVSGSAPIMTWFDALGREIRKDTYGLNNKKIFVDTEYYTSGQNKGRVYRISEPYFEGDAKTWATTYNTYDAYGRAALVTTPMGKDTTVYEGLSTTVKTPEGRKTTTLNSSGFVESSTVNGKTVSYTYYPSGLTKTATPEGGQSLLMEYNLQGKRTKLTDPDAGVIETTYNGFGELVKEKQKIHNASWIITTNDMESSTGRLNSISRNGETTSYIYDTNNRLSSIEISGQHKQTFSYDDFDRVTNIREEVGSKIFNKETSYDALGRIKKEIFPSGYYTVNHYDNDYGFLMEVKDKNGRQIWKVNSENARGQITEVQRGGKTTKFGFDGKGLPTGIKASGIVNLNYDFGNHGNLNYRVDSIMGQKEKFVYDGMNRLTNWNIYQNNVLIKPNSMVYNPNTGTITSKSDLGNFTMNYGENDKPHALTSIEGVPANFPTDSLNVTYTDFKKIKTLTEGNKHYTLTYGIDDQRRKSEYKINGITQKTKYYLGDYEEETDNFGNIKKIHYLSGGAILINTNGVETLYYGYSDYQGNLIALTNESGTVVERYAYDPWGKRRNPANWAENDSRTTWIVNRGYTGHEHLDAFSIINMNGRVYDPLTAMFFSPDPFVQAPDNWLNYNRYTYAYGNPFRYTDPDGESFWLIAAAVYFIFFTDPGYEIQKFFLPIAFHYDIKIGSDQKSVGLQASIGMPQMLKGYRYEGGISYVFDDFNDYKGWELQGGKEWSSGYKGYFTKLQHMSYDREGSKYDQHRDKITVGLIPGLITAEFENDVSMHNVFNLSGMPKHEDSDKYLTAQARLNFFGLQTGLMLFTGSPDGAQEKEINGHLTYVPDPNNPLATDVDDYRAGILYIGLGPLKFGVNSEKIRNATQNFLHRVMGWPEFRVIPGPAKPFWEFGW